MPPWRCFLERASCWAWKCDNLLASSPEWCIDFEIARTHRQKSLLGLPQRVKAFRACGYSSPFQRPFQTLVIAGIPHVCPDLTELFLTLLFSIFESTVLKLLQEPCARTSRPEELTLKLRDPICMDRKSLQDSGGEGQTWLNLCGFLSTIHGVTGMNREKMCNRWWGLSDGCLPLITPGMPLSSFHQISLFLQYQAKR